MSHPFTESELEAYLDEALSPDEMATLETALRDDSELARELMAIISRRDAGVHTVGGIWRRHRLTCPSREQLGSFLLGTLGKEHTDYLTFHIDDLGCRLCRANLEDLKSRRDEKADAVASRRDKYFQSSAGYLGKD